MMENIKNKLATFCELTRAYSILISVAPWFVALCWSAIYAPSILDAILTFIGIACVHLGTNLLDDVIDVLRELKDGKTFETIDFGKVSAKARLILNKTFSIKKCFAIVGLLYIIAILIGIYFTAKVGIQIPLIILLTGALCVAYPLATSFYLGEIVIALIFGPLIMTGTFMALSGMWSTRILIFSISVACALLTVLHAHALMDWEFDVERGKKTLCTLFKTKKNALKTLMALISIAYINILFFVYFGWLSPKLLLTLLVLPIAIKLVKSLNDYINVKDVEFTPKWWMGPMEDWDKIKQGNMAFFMYRFYMARNFGFLFCLIAGLACYLG